MVAARSRVLVVDDEPDILAGLRDILEDHFSAEVLTAASGTEALEHLRRGHFDLLVSDFRMPGIDGVQLMDAAQRMRPNLRCILVTAFDRDLVARLGARARSARILQKPIDPGAVIRQVSASLDRHGEPAAGA